MEKGRSVERPFFFPFSTDLLTALGKRSQGAGMSRVAPRLQVAWAQGRQEAIGALESGKFCTVDRAGFSLLDESVARGEVRKETLAGGEGLVGDSCRQIQLLGEK